MFSMKLSKFYTETQIKFLTGRTLKVQILAIARPCLACKINAKSQTQFLVCAFLDFTLFVIKI